MGQYIGNTLLVGGHTFCSGLHSFLRAVLRPQEALGGGIDPSQQQTAEPHFHEPAVRGLEPDRPARQAGGNKQSGRVPAEGSDLIDFPAVQTRVVQIFGRALIAARRVLVNLGRAFGL